MVAKVRTASDPEASLRSDSLRKIGKSRVGRIGKPPEKVVGQSDETLGRLTVQGFSGRAFFAKPSVQQAL